MDLTHLIVEAAPRYWEDATVNGTEDSDGSLIPLRRGDLWMPVIELATGRVLGWPAGTTARVHYKVCDQGKYWLGDALGNKVLKRKGHYVPDDLLCVWDRGWGDYIILNIDESGHILGWKKPAIDMEMWVPLETKEDHDADHA